MNTLYPTPAGSAFTSQAQMLQSYFETADQYQVLLNNELQIIAFNPFAASYTVQCFGKKLQLYSSIIQYFDPAFALEFRQLFNNALAGEVVSYEQYIHPEEIITWFSFRIQPLYVEGKVIGLMLTGNNISKQKSDEKIIRHQSEILSLIAQLQSHHVRQPVCSILSLTRLIKEDFEVKKAYIEGLESATRQLDEVIKAIVGQTRKE